MSGFRPGLKGGEKEREGGREGLLVLGWS